MGGRWLDHGGNGLELKEEVDETICYSDGLMGGTLMVSWDGTMGALDQVPNCKSGL